MRKVLLTFLFVAGCLMANAQWSSDPTENNLITPLGYGVYDFDLCVSKDGNTVINYLRPTGNIASVLQTVDKNGNMLFPEDGLTVSHKRTITWTAAGDLLFVDRDGNALVAVTDCRHSSDQDVSYTLYLVSPTGEMLWGENGLDISRGLAHNLVHSMKMVQLEDGSYVCAWGVTNYENHTYIQLQRISQTGEMLWDDEEVRLYSSSAVHEYPYLANAGNNQVVVVFTRGTGRHIVAKKIDFDGSNVWAEDLVIYRQGFTIPPLWVIIRVIPDEMGGAFVGWYDDRGWTNKESTYVAHVTANGTLGFASGEGGERVGYNENLRGFAPEMYFDKNESVLYVTWRETSSGQSWQQMTAQKLKIPSGELMWDPDGLEASPLTQDHSIGAYSIQGDGKGNVAIFFTSVTLYEPNQSWYGRDVNSALLINSNGEYVWKEKIIQFSSIESEKGRLVSSPLIDNSFWVTAWQDERKIEGVPSGNKKIYLQRINLDGTLGPGNSIRFNDMSNISFAVYPTIVNGPAEFHINTENPSKAEISLYSIMGQKIETIYLGMLHNGNNIISWNAPRNALSKGVYFVTLTLDRERKSLRIIVN